MVPRAFFLCSALFLTLIVTSVGHAAVWKNTATWNDLSESRYSIWVERSFAESIFTEGEWAGIETDCADAIYAARIIFSFQNGLPFSLGRSQPNLDNSTNLYDRILDPVLRVRAFIKAVNNRTWTGSLAQHTYPVAIRPDTILPGVMWFKPGHVEMVVSVRRTGVVELRGSWLPSAVRDLITITALGSIPSNKNLGFRRWIWPQSFDEPKRSLPGFDESQFQPPLRAKSELDRYIEISRFEDTVRTALATAGPLETSEERVQRMARDVCTLIRARSDVVILGYKYVEAAGRCLNEREYYAYSTPSRDSSLRRAVIGLGLELNNNLNRVEAALESCGPIAVQVSQSNGSSLSTKLGNMDFVTNLLRLNFSSDPHQIPAARFGVESSQRFCDGTDPDESDL